MPSPNDITSQSNKNPLVMVMMRRPVMVTVTTATAAVPTRVPLAAAGFAIAGLRSHAPEAVAAPSALLTLFAAIFRPPASAAFRELPGVLFPLAALPVGALPDAASALVFPAEVAHYDASPVLHVSLLRRGVARVA